MSCHGKQLVLTGALMLSRAAFAEELADPGGEPRPPDNIALVYENGDPNGVNAYSNATAGVFGARRTLLDDFVVDAGPVFLNGFRHHAVWNTLPPGSGQTLQIVFRQDANGTPGPIVFTPNITSYLETPTGRVFFSREEYTAFTTFETLWLEPGHYWLEAVVVGPENNFWLTADQRHSECWVDYEDLGGLMPGSEQVGVASDLAWELWGSVCTKFVNCCLPDGTCEKLIDCPECAEFGGRPVLDCVECSVCAADLDGNGVVTFSDLIMLLTAWGDCEGECPGDLDRDNRVGFGDLLILLSLWGPCVI